MAEGYFGDIGKKKREIQGFDSDSFFLHIDSRGKYLLSSYPRMSDIAYDAALQKELSQDDYDSQEDSLQPWLRKKTARGLVIKESPLESRADKRDCMDHLRQLFMNATTSDLEMTVNFYDSAVQQRSFSAEEMRYFTPICRLAKSILSSRKRCSSGN